jgi:hypothetical protein
MLLLKEVLDFVQSTVRPAAFRFMERLVRVSEEVETGGLDGPELGLLGSPKFPLASRPMEEMGSPTLTSVTPTLVR